MKTTPADSFSDRILAWFDQHGRKDLPWQGEVGAYGVWVSEIMLQQTQVKTVIPYYLRFMQRFPDVRALADAPLDDVMHHWSGLGYYARARNLHRAAQQLRDEFHGEFPRDSESLQHLPGIGRSTAGAILSLASGCREAILDGNVKRVLARFHAVEGWPGKSAVLKRLWQLAWDSTPEARVGEYNQAMMDLGATLCTRARPGCARCPLADRCQANSQGRQAYFPAPRPRKTLPVRRTWMLMLLDEDRQVLLQQRPPAGIWGGLWSLPEFASANALQDWCRARDMPAGHEAWPVVRHTFSHFHLDITPCLVHGDSRSDCVMEGAGGVWYNTRDPEGLGLAAPVKRLLERLEEQIEESLS